MWSPATLELPYKLYERTVGWYVLSAGMAVPTSWSDLTGSTSSSATTKTKGTVSTALLRRQGDSILGMGDCLFIKRKKQLSEEHYKYKYKFCYKELNVPDG